MSVESRLRVPFAILFAAAIAAGCAGHRSTPYLPQPIQALRAPSGAKLLTDAQAVKAAVEAAIATIPSPAPPGMALSVFYHGRVYFFYRGVLRIGGRNVDGNTIFELGSLTKSFTGIMLGTAVNQRRGGATLADVPSKWMRISGPPNAVAPQPEGGITCARPTATPVPASSFGTIVDMTILELATHTSGLPDLPPGPDGSHVGRQCFSPQQFVNYIETGTFQIPPAPWLYSNIGFGTLGYVLQGIYGKGRKTAPTWYALVREQIIVPMKMNHTFDVNVPRKYRRDYAEGYLFNGSTAVPQLHWEWDAWPAAGTLRSTASDMARYLKLALGVAGPAAARAGAVTAERPYVRITPGEQQGLAWETTSLYAASTPSPLPPMVTWKDGGTSGFSTWMGLLRPPLVARPMGIVVLFNEGGASYDGPIGRAILTPLYLRDVTKERNRR